MADVSDIEDALVLLARGALYPDGTSAPAPSAAGLPVQVFRGWPVAKALDDELRAGRACVSVSSTGTGRVTTRFLDEWRTVPRGPWPMTATLSETGDGRHRVTLSGSSEEGLCIGVRVLRVPCVASLAADDTPERAAERLAAVIPGASASGAAVEFPFAFGAEVRVGGRVTVRREWAREAETFRLAVWAPTPAGRDAVGRAVGQAVRTADWLAVSGEEDARLEYVGTLTVDEAGESRLWRRDVNVRVEFATYEEQVVPTLLFGVAVTAAVAAFEG